MPFSVLLSVYNKEKPEYLAEALKSIWNDQTLKPNEIVLIEDGELTAELYQVIHRFEQECPCLVTYRFHENVQLGRALAKGVELCTHELIARMDTDDIAVPQRFAWQCQYMREHPKVQVLGGWIEEFDEVSAYQTVKKMPENMDAIVAYAKTRNPINHMTAMMRRSAVIQVGNYVHFPFLEDYHLWSRMLAEGMVFHNLPNVLVKMRVNDRTYQRRGGTDYFRQYMSLRKKQKELGLLTDVQYAKTVILTWGMTSEAVSHIRKFLYRRILRR